MSDRPRVSASVHAALLAVQVMFASLATAGKLALRELSPFALVVLRVGSAMVVLWLVRLVLPARRERVEPRDLAEIALYALFGVTANILLSMLGLSYTTATNAVVIGTSIPVFTVGVALALGKEAATGRKLVGLAIAAAGAFIIVGAGEFEAGGTRLLGNLLCVVNSLSFSIYLVISRRLLDKYQPMTVVTWLFVFGTLGVLPFGARALVAEAPRLSAATWSWMAYIVFFPTVGTYFLNTFALKRVPSSLVAIYIYVQPVIGALLAAAILGERPAPSTYAGALLIGAGIWFVTREAARQRQASALP